MDSLWHYQFRIVLLGDSTVGKSSLLKRYTEGTFLDLINQTVGVDFYVQFLEVEPGIYVKLQFWDTAGQERFRSVTRSYYRNSAGGLLVFDLTNRKSFESVLLWYREVTEWVQPVKMVFLLVGHKNDLEAQRQVQREEAETFAATLGISYIETSAKTNSNVEAAFQLLTQEIYQAVSKGHLGSQEDWDGVKCRLPSKVTAKEVVMVEQEKRKTCQC
ncbi:ras-related protein Rab-39B [Microcaecilia unicolor]|uniref:Ras-related protein Rab-39B-like n=1 Tax=Microcaecilia unicolor TaxID=1415580 RepID=A0A6P7Z5B7_9AMPH|nr:ras-related protein Rab-39B-like [Microcaecilia unicolor]